MPLARILPSIRRRLEAWLGYQTLSRAMLEFDDLKVYVAGGLIRNELLGLAREPKDFDFFVGGESVASAMEYFSREGLLRSTPYGAPRWYPASDEGQYADLIPIADFIPGLWPCEDIVDVLNQFDFTANAVAFDLRTGQAFDPQNGARDALSHVMKMVRFDYPDGPFVPSATLNRNVILWFRVMHYASTLGLRIEPLTRSWLAAHRSFASQEDEFSRLFFHPNLQALKSLHE